MGEESDKFSVPELGECKGGNLGDDCVRNRRRLHLGIYWSLGQICMEGIGFM